MITIRRNTLLAGVALIGIVATGLPILLWRYHRPPSFTVLRPVAVPEIGEGYVRLPTEERAEPQPVEHVGSFALETEPAGALITIVYTRNQPRSGVEGEAPSGFAGGGGDVSPYKKEIRFLGTEIELFAKIAREGFRTEERRFLLTEERPDLKVKVVLGKNSEKNKQLSKKVVDNKNKGE